MRWTRTFIPTLRESPSEAAGPGERLLIRAGLTRTLASGPQVYLPLGSRLLEKAARLIREELDRTGAGALHVPSAVSEPRPHAPRRAEADSAAPVAGDRPAGGSGFSGGDEMIRLLGRDIKSYRQLPVVVYWFGDGFREEPKARPGHSRSRHSLRVDVYSCDADDKGLGRSYQAMIDAFGRVFARAGLKFIPVEADPGPAGGAAAHTFLAVSPDGEDSAVSCGKCGYAARPDRAECPPSRTGSSAEDTRQILPIQEIPTPGAHTVDQVCDFLKVPPRQLIKTLIFRTDAGFLAALVRGDHEVNEAKLRRAARVERLELGSPEDILRETGGPSGYSGPVGLRLRLIADHSVVGVCNGVVGANKADTHLTNVNVNRDFRPEMVADLRMAVPGDPCPRCRAPMGMIGGTEIGFLRKTGTPSGPQGAGTFLDDKGQLRPLSTGRYGIDIGRMLSASVERHHDEAGILWPAELAPYQVQIVSLDHQKLQIVETAHDLYEVLSRAGLEVLWDDRDLAAGVKLADADLIGTPVRIIVGKRTLESKTVDLRARNSKDQKTVLIEQVLDRVKNELSNYRA